MVEVDPYIGDRARQHADRASSEHGAVAAGVEGVGPSFGVHLDDAMVAGDIIWRVQCWNVPLAGQVVLVRLHGCPPGVRRRVPQERQRLVRVFGPMRDPKLACCYGAVV